MIAEFERKRHKLSKKNQNKQAKIGEDFKTENEAN
jgi:hypothetical protein